MATTKKKDACAVALGRKGGKAAKAKKKGIFSPAYKRKKKATAKRKTVSRSKVKQGKLF